MSRTLTFPRRCMLCAVALLAAWPAESASTPVRFIRPAAKVQVYDFSEFAVHIQPGRLPNPFTGAALVGEFRREGDRAPLRVPGFCDAPDGSVFRLRFMPQKPGRYSYQLTYSEIGSSAVSAQGTFRAIAGNRRGPVRVDHQAPWHFVWEGTGEHYFWNSTTAYALMGWDEETIHQILDRFQRLKVNRIRVALNPSRVKNGVAWFENVYPTPKFRFLANPWLAARPDSEEDPGFDVTRFNIECWRKYERMLRYARERDIVVSVIFYVDGVRRGVDPFGKQRMGNDDEQRYYRYAVARFAAFANVMWDVTNEWHYFRDAAWVERMGSLIKQTDPWQHLTSCHGRKEFPWMASQWADFAMYQIWDEEGGFGAMLERRLKQAATGRSLPQVNEEYGYEDHYPKGWGGNRSAPARSADTRRRLAWEISMAGCYQTTGERADRGTGWGPDSGGGWINGRGDHTMTMLEGYAHMRRFFESLPWWRLEPRPDLCPQGTMLLAEPGVRYVLYLRQPERARVRVSQGSYRARWFNPRSGTWTESGAVEQPTEGVWTSPMPEGGGDWALVLEKR